MVGMLPVTVVIARTPAPGREEDLLAWAHGIAEAAEDVEGHLGARILRAGERPESDVVVAFSFDSTDHLNDWEASPLRQSWLDRLDGLVAGAATTHSVSGFEAIFSSGADSTAGPPPRWKTATIIALALYPISVLLGWALGPTMQDWNVWTRSLVTVAIVVPYMAWLGVPQLSRLLRRWLYRG